MKIAQFLVRDLCRWIEKDSMQAFWPDFHQILLKLWSFRCTVPLAQENFFLAAVDVGILHATMKNQVKMSCKLTHFWYPRVAFLLAFMLIPYRNRELKICSFYSYINILHETNRYETIQFQWRHVSAPRHDCRQNTEWDLIDNSNDVMSLHRDMTAVKTLNETL